jgi:nicotinamide-nucleotide amidase
MPILESNKTRCSLICVGSELLRGKINTHCSTLARRLASIGLVLGEEHTVTDAPDDIARAIHRALEENQVILVSGGLGPTFDDLTREAASAATGYPLVFVPALLRGIEAKFRRVRVRKMPPENERQAYLLQGAEAIPNRIGTAPGQWLELASSKQQAASGDVPARRSPLAARILILLPGPPSELDPMLDEFILPHLQKAFPAQPSVEAHLHFVGVPESVIDHKVRPIIARHPGADFTILAHLGLVDLDVFVSASSKKEADRKLDQIVRALRAKTGKAFYGMNEDYPLEKVVMKDFVSHHATLAVAESCTGGMLAKRLTDISGSSDYFLGGVVSYSNRVKMSALGVPSETLRKHGAVSKETALAMARGVRERLGSTWGISITGIAGPTGGTPAKPVGLVYLGLAGPRSARVYPCQFRGDRDAIRTRTVIQALDLLRQIYL